MLASALDLGGEGFVNQLVTFLVIGLVVGILYAIAHYFATRPKAPAIALTIVNGAFILIGGLALINFLLGLVGKGFIKW